MARHDDAKWDFGRLPRQPLESLSDYLLEQRVGGRSESLQRSPQKRFPYSFLRNHSTGTDDHESLDKPESFSCGMAYG
jgi:hypothetical protein